MPRTLCHVEAVSSEASRAKFRSHHCVSGTSYSALREKGVAKLRPSFSAPSAVSAQLQRQHRLLLAEVRHWAEPAASGPCVDALHWPSPSCAPFAAQGEASQLREVASAIFSLSDDPLTLAPEPLQFALNPNCLAMAVSRRNRPITGRCGDP